jgi:hypothetical protein
VEARAVVVAVVALPLAAQEHLVKVMLAARADFQPIMEAVVAVALVQLVVMAHHLLAVTAEQVLRHLFLGHP